MDIICAVRNASEWIPGWCVLRDSELTHKRDRSESHVPSRLVATVVDAAANVRRCASRGSRGVVSPELGLCGSRSGMDLAA